jgi:hypothetical protein
VTIRVIPTAPDTPKGWVVFNKTLQPDITVAGYALRREQVIGFCQEHQCKRTCSLDLERLVQIGLGRLALKDLQSTFRCARIGGCYLNWMVKRPEPGLTLLGLSSYPMAAIRFRCEDCGDAKIVRPLRAAELLAAAGKADRFTPIQDLPQPAKSCAKCGKSRWAVEVAWGATR